MQNRITSNIVLASLVARRFRASIGGSDDFCTALEAMLPKDRHFGINNKHSLGRKSDVYVNFINVPKEENPKGAQGENNRMSFWIEGFPEGNEPPPSGKVKIEMSVSALDRKYKLRAKTGTPDQIAKYLSDFLKKVTEEVPPKLDRR